VQFLVSTIFPIHRAARSEPQTFSTASKAKDGAMDAVDQQALTGAVIKEYRLDLAQLWLAFVGLGGDASEQFIRDYCAGEAALSAQERDALAQAVNEHCAAEGLPLRAPLSGSALSVPQPGRRDPKEKDPKQKDPERKDPERKDPYSSK
jgi:hypothetical protein